MAAEASRAPSVREQTNIAQASGVSLSRRLLLGAALAAPIAATAVAVPAPAKAAVSSALTGLIARCVETGAAADRYEAEVYQPARVRWQAAVDAVPHIEVDGPTPTYDGGPVVWSTEMTGRVQHAKWGVRQRVVFDGPGSEAARRYHMAQRKLVAAALRRERQMDRLRKAHGIDALYAESERIEQLFYDAVDAVVDYPVATLADFDAKVGFMVERKLFERFDVPEVIQRDVANLLRGEG